MKIDSASVSKPERNTESCNELENLLGPEHEDMPFKIEAQKGYVTISSQRENHMKGVYDSFVVPCENYALPKKTLKDSNL
jgi:hypothetical protein